MTVRFPPENLTRAPLELGCRPARSSRTPAFISSSLYLPMAESSASLGILPASESLLAFTIIMKRMGFCLLWLAVEELPVDAGLNLAPLRRRMTVSQIDMLSTYRKKVAQPLLTQKQAHPKQDAHVRREEYMTKQGITVAQMRGHRASQIAGQKDNSKHRGARNYVEHRTNQLEEPDY